MLVSSSVPADVWHSPLREPEDLALLARLKPREARGTLREIPGRLVADIYKPLMKYSNFGRLTYSFGLV